MSRRGKKNPSIAREEKKLRKIFERILLVAIVVPAAVVDACSNGSTTATPIDTADAANDSGLPASGANDAAGVGDGADRCAPISLTIDAAIPDGSVDCDIFNEFSCGIPPVTTPRSDCFFSLNDCPALCPGAYFFNCRSYGNWCVDGSFLTSEDGGITLDDGSVVALDPQIVECATCPNGAGRRPRGLKSPRSSKRKRGGKTTIGRYFALTAHLEKASIGAFRSLQKDLARLGAPRALVRSAARASGDEVRHARAIARIARLHGSVPPPVVVASKKTRASLEDVAFENAIEGCVRETFGALVASWQAAHAEDALVAATMRVIAADETRHAALAWSIAAWSTKRLDFAALARARKAAACAITELEVAAANEPHPDLIGRAGVPSRAVQRAMLRELRRTLWSTS